ncbi:hypothetical protein IB229_12910 [Pseudomonas sp. PDM14]|uniref:hypothetical protein n=1 Tax=Pseudomonas sp. PDM14 TaxID=2769288 RepID=UPI00177BBDB4|nr:hypothetical protein [Pseudomonas sp. PDM14]MBD9483879.1 hypothetical protein [Pseudomonas sp. PDM14]
MNTTALLDPAKEYRASMQRAALCFMERHQAEHLSNEAALLDRATSYLVKSLDVPLFMAPRLAQLALSELSPTVIGIDLATQPDVAVLARWEQGQHRDLVLVARRILPHRFLAAPAAP